MKKTAGDLKHWMTDKRGVPLDVFEVNNSYVMGIYPGKISENDIIIRYRQNINGSWSKLRQPRHIHWAVDILTKMNSDKQTTLSFLEFLILLWDRVQPIATSSGRTSLSIENLLKENQQDIHKYDKLSLKGEYSIKFLILLAKLLMIQEKTNRPDAYMFKKLLNALQKGNDIFAIISKASYSGKKIG